MLGTVLLLSIECTPFCWLEKEIKLVGEDGTLVLSFCSQGEGLVVIILE